MLLRILPVLLILVSTGCQRHDPQTISTDNANTRIQVCFTPGEDCATLLIDQINAAQKDIKVQAFSFTSYPIAKALVRAAGRGVDVKVILDKTQFDGQHFSVSNYLFKKGITLFEDNKVNIAHNKIMIFDDHTIETGSYNFTRAAQNDNAENMLIIQNKDIAAAFLDNWQAREQQSIKVNVNDFQINN